MAENIPIEDVERVEIAPSGGGETIETEQEGDEPEGNEPEGGAEPADPREPKEQLVHRKPEEPADNKSKEDISPEGGTPAEVEGETPREKALRLEIERLRTVNRKERAAELLGDTKPPTTAKKELSPEKQEVLKRYNPSEIEALREVLPALAEELGYVRTDQLSANQYNDKAQEELDSFLEHHPEYLPENDKDNVLWPRFKQEFGIYAQPANPKDYKKIFNKVHNEIFGIRPVGDKGAITAAQRKIQVASHAGASGPARSTAPSSRKPNTTGLRLDMLRGFSEEDLASMQGEE